jgi:carboxypeptidase C (cathepsin A)
MRFCALLQLALVAMLSAVVHAEDAASKDKAKPDAPAIESFKPEEKQSEGTVTIGGQRIDYQATAGTLVVHAKGWDDVPQNADKEAKEGPAEASMFYVAYLKKGVKAADRPVTFIYNGGPGSSTVWLHMGAFGPRRVVTADDTHSAAAPYAVVNNEYSLLDASDLVFIDAPGAGFSRVAGKDREKAFYGVDGDAHAFAEFITQFLGKYGRWNSPKYLLGESYGTTRSAALVSLLETDQIYNVDFNGVIMLSQILAFDGSVDGPGRGGSPEDNPGVELPYELALPTYAASAWYHHKLPGTPGELAPLLAEVESFALGEYATALAAGSALEPARRDAIAGKLHDYTGLPVEYILKANLRINGGKFEQNLGGDTGSVTGRLDTRFNGPAFDPLSEAAEYDPQLAAISSAYISAFNDYVRKDLKFGEGRRFKLFADDVKTWNIEHQAPGTQAAPQTQTLNVIPDLSIAMKYNPKLRIQLNAGYYDLATPFFGSVYEMHHLQIPPKLQDNIEYRFYESGHMVYAHEESLRQFHANAARFISGNSNVGAAQGGK